MKERQIIPFRFTSKISEFDAEMLEDIGSSLQEQRKAILPSENVFKYTHGKKWRTIIAENNDQDDDGQMQTHSSEIQIPVQEVVDNDLGSLVRYRNSIVSGLIKDLMQSIYQAVNDSTEKTGNVIGAKSGSFTAEHFVEMLEKIEFGVDRDGNVSLPEIHASPELVKKMLQVLSVQGSEFEKRVQEITQRKSEAALARENDRKSKFPKHGDK